MRLGQLAILMIIVQSASAAGQNYTFSYSMQDVMIIPYLSNLDISTSLATSTYEQIEDGILQLNQTFQQKSIDNGGLIPYNIIYFNLANPNGSLCYYDYFSMGKSPNLTQPCSNISNIAIFQTNYCVNFTYCLDETLNYSINLSQLSYKQSVVLIQNNQPYIANKQNLYLKMSTIVRVLNSNGWFYWSVALTCLLLLSFVLLTGVVLYWSLKLTKAQRALEELRLTQVDEEVSSIRKSLRKSIMKQQ